MSKKLDTTWHVFLYGALALGALAAYLSRFDASGQFFILTFLICFYLVWGFAYHSSKRDASVKLFWEYVAIAMIALGAGYLVLMS